MSTTKQYDNVNENRRKAADDIIINRTLYAGGTGLIFVPILDAVALLGVQMYMIRDIASIYDIEFKEQRVKSLIGALIGDTATLSLFRFIPGIGSFFGTASTIVIGAASTYALGKVFVKHFEAGGTFLNFDPIASEKYFKQKLAEGKQVVKNIRKNSFQYKSTSAKQQPKKNSYTDLSAQTKKLSEEIASLKKDIESIKQLRHYTQPISKIQDDTTKYKKIDLTDLCLIKGIGLKTAAVLQQAGIKTIQDLADSTPEDIETILAKEDGRFRLVISDSWIVQAQLATTSDLETLQAFQKKLP